MFLTVKNVLLQCKSCISSFILYEFEDGKSMLDSCSYS